jgi:glucose-1-phosphate thymidylyltransferase
MKEAIRAIIEHDIRGKGGEFQLTDALDRMLKEGAVFKTASVTEWLDCGTIEALLDTTKLILARESDDLHQGETDNSVIIDPVYIGPGARVSHSVVGPNVSIEANANVSGSILRDSIVFAHAKVENAVLTNSLIGQHADIHPPAGRMNVGDHSEIGS